MILKGHLQFLHVPAPFSCPHCRPSSEISDKRLKKLIQDPRNTRRLPFLIIQLRVTIHRLVDHTLSLPASHNVLRTRWFNTLCMSSYITHTKRISSIYPLDPGFTNSFPGTIIKVRPLSLTGVELMIDDLDLFPVNLSKRSLVSATLLRQSCSEREGRGANE
jgi:hypothetical protein